MKKLVLAASIAVLGLSAQAANTSSSATPSTTTAAATSSTPATPAAAPVAGATPAASTPAPSAAPAKKADKAPQDSAETKMYMDNYPELVKRISPIGKTCAVGQKCKVPAAQPMVPGATANVGELVFQNVCTNCHGAGMLGAPKFEDKADWAPRIAKGKATLYDHALKGFNQMPAKGGDSSLSDADVKSAVDYMVSKSS